MQIRKSIYLAILPFLVVTFQQAAAQCPDNWGLPIGKGKSDDLTTLATGDEYTYTLLQPSGTFTYNGKSWGSADGSKMVLLKINDQGNIQRAWQNQDGILFGSDLAIGPQNHLYITGNVRVRTNFQGEQFMPQGDGEAFILKIDTAGAILAKKLIGNNGFESGLALDVNQDQQVFLAGNYYKNGLTIGDSTLLIEENHRPNNFLTLFDKQLNPVWVTQIAGRIREEVKSVNFDNQGGVIVTGEFNSGFAFGGQTFSEKQAGDLNGFVLKLNDNNGKKAWLKHHSGGGYESTFLSATGPDGAVYTGGHFNQLIRFGEGSEMINEGNFCSYLTKYTATGKLSWKQKLCGFSIVDFNEIVFNNQANELVSVGYFQRLLTLPYDDDLACNSDSCSFLMKFNPHGGIKAYKKFAGTQPVFLSQIAYNDHNDLLIGGSHKGEWNAFGQTFSSENEFQSFIGKYCSDLTVSRPPKSTANSGPEIFYSPYSGALRLKSKFRLEGAIIEVYSAVGQQVLNTPLNSNRIPLKNRLEPGVYTYQVRSQKGKTQNTGKFVVVE